MEDYYFDHKYGIDTLEIIKVEDLDVSEKDKKHSFRYQPTRERYFCKLLKELRFPQDSVFVDMGSGKGKVLLMAMEYNFKRIIGVEISSELCKQARENLVSYEKWVKKNYLLK